MGIQQIKKAVLILRHGGIVVMPTDTIYGILGSALDGQVVERIYKIRKRQPKKPCIILIADMASLKRFGISLSIKEKCFLNTVWPGRVSVVLPCRDARYAYLHRGTKSLAFRMPRDEWLRMLLHETGPLIAPSANPEGKVPSETMREAKKYFGEDIDLYVSGGRRIKGKASTVVSINNKKVEILREGAVKISRQ